MDDLTRERFWPRPLPPAPPVEDVVSRQLVLLGIEEDQGEAMQQARLRAEAWLRSRRFARAIRMYSVRTGSA